MADNPWSSIQGLSAIDQKLYQSQSPQVEHVVPSSSDAAPDEKKEVPIKRVVTPQKQQQVKKHKTVEHKEPQLNTQLNAWITEAQNDTLDKLYFSLRARGMKLKKGELVGVGIEVLATIFDEITPKTIDSTLLATYLNYYEKQKQKKT